MIRTKSTRHKALRAFTLIEVMVAATLLLIGMMGVLQAYASGHSMRIRNSMATTSLTVVERQLEGLFILQDQSSELTIGPHGPLYFSAKGEPASAGPVSLEYNVSALGTGEILLLDMTVSWGTGARDSFSIKGYRR